MNSKVTKIIVVLHFPQQSSYIKLNFTGDVQNHDPTQASPKVGKGCEV